MAPTPGVVTWFRVYCGALSLVYLALLVAGIAFLFFGAFAGHLPDSEEVPRALLIAYGLVVIVLGAVFAAAFAAGAFLPPKPWVWIYGLVLIAFGFTSACCLPFCIALLIFWLKPEVKVHFGRPA
jgi:MFS family permease